MDFSYDLRGLNRAVALYREAVPKKTVPEILNRAGRNVALHVIKLTPKADRAKVEADLRRQTGLQTHGKSGRALKNARPIHTVSTVARAGAARALRKKGVDPRRMGGPAFDAAVRKLIASRLSGIAYLRAGWLAAGLAFGASGGATLRNPRIGRGLAASSSRPFAELLNLAAREYAKTNRVTIREARIALQQTIRYVANDMKTFATKLLQAEGRRAGFR